jgi:glucose-6-phosphate 1-dehydrogenase
MSAPPVQQALPTLFVIFGATGDLTGRKLYPALYNLAAADLLPKRFGIVGYALSDLDDAAFRASIESALAEHFGAEYDAQRGRALTSVTRYLSGRFDDEAGLARLAALIAEQDRTQGTGGRALFYLATPPSFFGGLVETMGRHGLLDEGDQRDGRDRRVIVEKPFGRDLDSARELTARLGRVMRERQILRIDHYLGKETVQNLLFFRFVNGIFEPVWNRGYVDHVQITVAEELGVEHRARYYEEAGALRDMVPNHLFQLLALTAMEPPTSFEAEAVRDERAKLLSAVRPLDPEDVLQHVVRGQYGAGMVGGEHVVGYRDEERVAADSATETFVALRLAIDNWRWAGVPFYLRTGKRLPQRATEVVIRFQRPPLKLFRGDGEPEPNQLIVSIQPEEGISLSFGAKVPGPIEKVGTVDMRFSYGDYFGRQPSTGYETLLYDAMCGDATLFQRADAVEAGWRIVEPVLDAWRAIPPRAFPNYAAGSWGPDAARELLEREGRAWHDPD